MKNHIYLTITLALVFSSCSTEKEEPIQEPTPQSKYPAGSVFGPSGPTIVVDVTNPKTGKTWMDRNLGATRAATSSTDVESFGDLYQWGRGADGHQLRTSTTTTSLSSSDQPGNGSFITITSIISERDWRSPQNNNLWQGVIGINNPCPSGYRLPTIEEWNTETLSWGSNNSAGAFSSPLKLPNAGGRNENGVLFAGGGSGFYWSSTVSGIGAKILAFSGVLSLSETPRAIGRAVRCIKD